jgi:hypothetical protein
MILILGFQEKVTPRVWYVTAFLGVLATLSKFSDFVLVLQTTILILILEFQEMVIPRGGM